MCRITGNRLIARTSSSSSITRNDSAPAIIPRINLRIVSNDQAFNNNEDVKVFWNGKAVTTLQAGSTGKLDSTFVIPANEVSGTKKISVKGEDSGVEGETSFRAEPLLRIVNVTYTNIYRYRLSYWFRWWWWWWDPIAQSFKVEDEITIDSVKVWFDTAPTSQTVCSIVENTVGYPDTKKVLTNISVSADELSDNSPYTFEFPDKVVLSPDKDYSFIVACNDAVGTVRTAKMGERTKNTGIWLTGQAYQNGVMFKSSNASTWTPVQDEDLMFEIKTCEIESTRTFEFESVQVTNMTDFIFAHGNEVKQGTKVTYKAVLEDLDPVKELDIDPNVQVTLDNAYTGNITIRMKMESDGRYTPTADSDGQLMIGVLQEESSYTTKGIAFDPEDSQLVLYVDQFKNNNAQVKYECQMKKNDSWDWYEFTPDTYKEIGEGWQEVLLKFDITDVEPDSDQDITRLRVTITCPDSSNRASIANLRLNRI
jgi:hypothetical protein